MTDFEDTEKKGLKDKILGSSQAAKLSGVVIEGLGKLKQKAGTATANESLKSEGFEQEIKGKIYKAVGEFRALKETALSFIEGQAKTQAIKVLDIAVEKLGSLSEYLKNLRDTNAPKTSEPVENDSTTPLH